MCPASSKKCRWRSAEPRNWPARTSERHLYEPINRWLAASYLDLSLCTKLTATGNSEATIQCKALIANFTTKITKCGPQPHYNKTINVKGWKLTKFTDCYPHCSFVNFNSQAYIYKNQYNAICDRPRTQVHQHPPIRSR